MKNVKKVKKVKNVKRVKNVKNVKRVKRVEGVKRGRVWGVSCHWSLVTIFCHLSLCSVTRDYFLLIQERYDKFKG